MKEKKGVTIDEKVEWRLKEGVAKMLKLKREKSEFSK